MESFLSKYKKIVSFFILISLFSCIVLRPQIDTDICQKFDNLPNHHEIYTVDIDHFVEVENVEEITLSVEHATLIRQLASKKSHCGFLEINLIAEFTLLPLLFAAFLLFRICFENIRDSHTYIMNFIHSTDGQKA